MKKLVVAVSGGVDSVVLLNMLVQQHDTELIVAHFDHGIRSESDADARFVHGLATAYGLPFFTKREELGAQASEELARDRRYAFLHEIANSHAAQIAVAHHGDDVIESVVINISRGTGWRGVSPMRRKGIVRPLLAMTKQDIYTYALRHNLEWVEDETNQSDLYLRNRVRQSLGLLSPSTKNEILNLRLKQGGLRDEIQQEIEDIAAHFDQKKYSRYFFIAITESIAIEILRYLVGYRITHPQARRGLMAVKTAQSGSIMQLGNGCRLEFQKTDFIVETP